MVVLQHQILLRLVLLLLEGRLFLLDNTETAELYEALLLQALYSTRASSNSSLKREVPMVSSRYSRSPSSCSVTALGFNLGNGFDLALLEKRK